MTFDAVPSGTQNEEEKPKHQKGLTTLTFPNARLIRLGPFFGVSSKRTRLGLRLVRLLFDVSSQFLHSLCVGYGLEDAESLGKALKALALNRLILVFIKGMKGAWFCMFLLDILNFYGPVLGPEDLSFDQSGRWARVSIQSSCFFDEFHYTEPLEKDMIFLLNIKFLEHICLKLRSFEAPLLF